jgi:endonuclease/exonuclease/phosphatase family metal-dependent hydrolase
MKLFQANIWGGRLPYQINEALKSERPDLVCFQEVVSTKGDALIFKTLEEIKEEIGLDNSFFSPVFSFNLMNKKAGFGNGIISRYPFIETNTVFTRLEHKDNFDFDTDDYNVRNFQHVTIEVDGRTLNILNHHGHHIHQHKNGDTETLRQCGEIASYINNLQGEVILTGDFNLEPTSESIKVLNSILKNLSIEAKLTSTRNELTPKNEVCDYIFVSKGIKVNKFYMLDKILSDHNALILEFDL